MSRQLPEPAVTVVMPFLDCAAFLDEAVRSVRTQTLAEWELLLVDDGSSDGSSRIAAAHASDDPARIRVLHHPHRANHGSGASRALGIAAARGRYIAFLDGDDVYEPSRLERHVQVLDAAPQLAAVQGLMRYWHSWDEGAVESDRDEPPPLGAVEGTVRPPGLLVLLLASHGASAPGISVLTGRASALQSFPPVEGVPTAAYTDQVIYAQLYLAGPVRIVNEVHARYRQHSSSVTRSAGPERLAEARLQFLRWLARLQPVREDPQLLSLVHAEQAIPEEGQSEKALAAKRMWHLARRIAPPALLRWRGRRKLAARTAANLRIVAPYLEPGDSRES
jgi:glycosyltransferase involved in cell wall biosynthesis